MKSLMPLLGTALLLLMSNANAKVTAADPITWDNNALTLTRLGGSNTYTVTGSGTYAFALLPSQKPTGVATLALTPVGGGTLKSVAVTVSNQNSNTGTWQVVLTAPQNQVTLAPGTTYNAQVLINTATGPPPIPPAMSTVGSSIQTVYAAQ